MLKPADRAVGIVLAAGLSETMKEADPLLPIGDGTLLTRAIESFRAAGVRQIIVVTGREAEKVDPFLDDWPVSVVFNPFHQNGQFSAVRAGVFHLDGGREYALVLPCEAALAGPEAIHLLADAARLAGADALYPTFDGKRGAPALVSYGMRSPLLDATPISGLDEVIEESAKRIVEVPVPSKWITVRLDDPEALIEAREWKKPPASVPTPDQCEEILLRSGLSEKREEHSRAVARLSAALASELMAKGEKIDAPLLYAAALVHDIDKERTRDTRDTRHGESAAIRLREMGHPEVAELVAVHSYIEPPSGERISEAEILFLADKMALKGRLAPLEERFAAGLKRHADEPEVLEFLEKQNASCRAAAGRIEKKIGQSATDVASRLVGWAPGGDS